MQDGCLLQERTTSYPLFPHRGFSPLTVAPPHFPALGSRVRRLVYKLGTHHAKSPYGAVLQLIMSRRFCNNTETIQTSLVFIASFLRYLHCGRYPWLWNDEHVLVLPAVV